MRKEEIRGHWLSVAHLPQQFGQGLGHTAPPHSGILSKHVWQRSTNEDTI